jgi:hypothetical protein
VFNQTQKFPEMNAYAISRLYTLKNEQETITSLAKGTLTLDNVLTYFDTLMDKMDEAEVPVDGRKLYVDTYTKTMIDTAKESARYLNASDTAVKRNISRIDEVTVISVPTKYMKSAYTFYTGAESSGKKEGYAIAADAKDVKMMLIHLDAVIPAINYEFAQLEEPSTLSKGKYVYFEESFEDLFIYNQKHSAIQFIVENAA